MWKRILTAGLLLLLCAFFGARAEAEASAANTGARVDVVAHRGLSLGFPENTMAAFRNILLLDVDVIELDLRGTSDGEVVVFHDATVERTTNGIGAIADLTLVEVRALDAGSYVSPTFAHERIPTLEEVLDLVHGSGVKLLLDVKQSQVLDKKRVVRLIERYDLLSDVMVGVRSVSDLSGFRALNPNLRTLGFVPDVDSIESFVRAGVDIVRLWPDWIRKSRANLTCRYQYLRRLLARGARTADIGSASCLVHRVQSMGKPVWVTAGNASGEALTELVRLRVNGILTDLPEVLTDLLAGRKGQRSSTKASSK